MEVLNFADFQKELKGIGLKYLKIEFDFRSAKIITLPFFNDIFSQLFIWGLSTFLILYPPALFFGMAFLVWSLYLFYINFIGWDVCRIDFNVKTFSFKNRFFILNLFRKLFGIKSELQFSEIKKIGYKEGPPLKRVMMADFLYSRYYLLLETDNDPAVIISQFKNEKDAESLVSILRKFILHKEKIIA